MYVCTRLVKSEAGTGCPGTGVRDSCGSPRECWDPSLGPLQKQRAVLKAKPPKSVFFDLAKYFSF